MEPFQRLTWGTEPSLSGDVISWLVLDFQVTHRYLTRWAALAVAGL